MSQRFVTYLGAGLRRLPAFSSTRVRLGATLLVGFAKHPPQNSTEAPNS